MAVKTQNGVIFTQGGIVQFGECGCDCDPVDPPAGDGGCKPCGVAPDIYDNWTAYFDNCIGKHTPLSPPPVLPGEDSDQFDDDYNTRGWNAPTVKISGTMQQNFAAANPNAPTQTSQYLLTIASDTPFPIIRSELCNTFSKYAPVSEDPNYDSRLILHPQWTVNGTTRSVPMDISTAGIQFSHDYGRKNGTFPPCTQFIGTALNNQLNLRLLLIPVASPDWSDIPGNDANTIGSFDFNAATGNASPCFGSGFSNLTWAVGGPDDSKSGVTFSGNCSSFTVNWSGSSSTSNVFGDYTASWDVTLTFENMDQCPTTGACCLGEACGVVTPAVCDSIGGTFYGLGTTCEEIDCNDPPALMAESSCSKCGDEGEKDIKI